MKRSFWPDASWSAVETRAFNEMQARIARFDVERMRTLAEVGHDPCTPTTGLRIRAELWDEEDGAPFIRTLDDMAVLADVLVSFALQSGEGEEPQSIDVCELLKRLCSDRSVKFGPKIGGLTVRGRPVALGRAFGNLIDNAL